MWIPVRGKFADAEVLASDAAKAQRLKLQYIEAKSALANAAVQTALITVALRLQDKRAKT